jgi:hypothetical protein
MKNKVNFCLLYLPKRSFGDCIPPCSSAARKKEKEAILHRSQTSCVGLPIENIKIAVANSLGTLLRWVMSLKFIFLLYRVAETKI